MCAANNRSHKFYKRPLAYLVMKLFFKDHVKIRINKAKRVSDFVKRLTYDLNYIAVSTRPVL